MNCNTINIQIEGPGILYQTVTLVQEEEEDDDGKYGASERERTMEDHLLENVLGISTSITPEVLQVQATETIEEEVSFKIFNAMGQIILDMTVSELSMSAQSVDISGFAAGIFFLEVHHKGELMYMEKFLK